MSVWPYAPTSMLLCDVLLLSDAVGQMKHVIPYVAFIRVFYHSVRNKTNVENVFKDHLGMIPIYLRTCLLIL